MSYFRHPRTTQERRNEDELTRPSRRSKNLPQSYDDIYPSDVNDRSWKKSRKSQYREVDM